MNAPIQNGEWVDDSYDYDDGHYSQYEEELYPQPPVADRWYYGPPVRYGPVSGPMMTASAPTETTGTDENALISGATAADALLPTQNTGGEKTGGGGDPEDLFDGYWDRFEEENGPPVDGKLAKIANAIWSQGRNTTIMKETFWKYPRPENVSCYKVDVNDKILQGLTRNQTAKNRDSRLRTAQGTVARACLPAVKIAEAVMDRTKEISRKSIMSMALDTLTLLSDTNQVVNQLRRDLLKPGIQPRFQSFCKLPKSADATQFLFGDNLSERIKAEAQGGRVAKRPYGPPGSFYGPMRIGLDWICLTTTHVLQDILAILHK